MQKQAKKFIFILMLANYVFLSAIIAIDYVIDPFEVTQSHFLKPVQEFINQRVYKIRVVDTNHNQFDSYILGTSRAQDIHPQHIEKYIPGSHFYNLSFHSSALAEYALILRYMQEQHYPIKNLFIQLDPIALYEPLTADADPQWSMSLLPPRVAHDWRHLLLYYKVYYTQLMFEQLWHKWAHRDIPTPELFFDTSGVTHWVQPERLMTLDHAQYVREKFPQTPMPHRLLSNAAHLEENTKELALLIDICKQHHIRCIFITPPLNQHYLDEWNVDYMIDYMRAVSELTGFWNFTDYNTITQDDYNFIDMKHYRIKIIPLIMARVFNDSAIPVPKDFGVFINEKNFSLYEKTLRSQARRRDTSSSP